MKEFKLAVRTNLIPAAPRSGDEGALQGPKNTLVTYSRFKVNL